MKAIESGMRDRPQCLEYGSEHRHVYEVKVNPRASVLVVVTDDMIFGLSRKVVVIGVPGTNRRLTE
jgi:hypothetical protein